MLTAKDVLTASELECVDTDRWLQLELMRAVGSLRYYHATDCPRSWSSEKDDREAMDSYVPLVRIEINKRSAKS
jgi:hypothetical protein